MSGSNAAIADRFREYATLGVEHLSLLLEPSTPAGIARGGEILALLRE